MDKILCSREPWDSILGFNRPNGTSRSWNLAEDGKLDFPYTLTEDFTKGCMKHNHPPHHTAWDGTDDFEDIEIHEIGDREHIYPIRVMYHEYFQKNLNQGFSCVSPKVLEDVRAGKAFICIECSSEGKYFMTPGMEFDVIERWRIKENLPEYSVRVFSGNLLCDEIVKKSDLKIIAVPSSNFHNFFQVHKNYRQNDKIVPFNPIDNKFLFLSFNRAPRAHRFFLSYLLEQKNVLEKGKLSLGVPDPNHQMEKLYPSHLFDRDKFRKFVKKGTRIIDEPLNGKNLATNFNIGLYKSTFMSIITETVTDSNCIFFSEKIWKPISIGHPFMLVSSPGSLSMLKRQGYRTFDKWWDESYDNEKSEGERINKIAKEVEKLSKLSKDRLKEIREEMKEVLLHNKTVFQNTLREVYPEGLCAEWTVSLKKMFLNK